MPLGFGAIFVDFSSMHFSVHPGTGLQRIRPLSGAEIFMWSKIFTGVAVLLVGSGLSLASIQAAAHDFRKLVKKTDPSVVLLYTEGRGVGARVGPRGRANEVGTAGLGSGVLIDNDGHVLTAAHVVQTADSVAAHFVDGTVIKATVIRSHPEMDVALLALDRIPEGIKPAKLGDSDKVSIGDQIFVIGAPLGLSHSFSVGHISRRHDNRTDANAAVRAEVFQTDAAINQGNSGGPMFNNKGQVIGIVSYIQTRSGGSEGLGFAVTINEVVRSLFEERALWSGMSGIVLPPVVAEVLNVPGETGFLVQKIAANSPAEAAGLRASRIPARIAGLDLLVGGDVLLSLAGVDIDSGMMLKDGEDKEKMSKKLAAGESGEMSEDGSAQLRVFRDGKIINLVIPLEATPLRGLAP